LSDLSTLTIDVSCLERILKELLNNASKYSPAEALIHFYVWQETDSTCFKVTNFGVEISDEELPHVFDKFYRIPNKNPWKHSGTGLGLALVQKLVSHLNGTVQAASAENRTEFTVKIPRIS
jgi:signal transduction histidine kinase